MLKIKDKYNQNPKKKITIFNLVTHFKNIRSYKIIKNTANFYQNHLVTLRRDFINTLTIKNSRVYIFGHIQYSVCITLIKLIKTPKCLSLDMFNIQCVYH